MRRDAGRADSVWTPIHIDSDGALQQDVAADVCVIGAGLVGLCTAYQLMKDGRRVVVLDDGPIGGGESARVAGDVRTVPSHLVDLVRGHGASRSRMIVQSQLAGMQWLEDLIQKERISCGWKRIPGYLLAPGVQEAQMAHRLGLEAEPSEAALREPAEALRFDGQGRLEPLAFLAGLAGVLRRGGVAIHTSTHAARVEGRVVTSTDRVIQCTHVVQATNHPIFGAGPDQQANRNYLVANEIQDASDALYWDLDPHLVHVASGVAITSGSEHPTGDDPDHSATFGELEVWGRQQFDLGHATHRWSMQVWRSRDALPSIGRGPESLVATGDGGNPVILAALSAMLNADLVAGRKNPWEGLYDPRRLDMPTVLPWKPDTRRLRAARRRVMMPGEVRDVAEIGRGQGAIMRKGLRLHACARDEEGVVHQNLAVCPRDGCIVAWNSAEKTWDCPCDGSRFDRDGAVINAPANANLGSYSSQPDDGICANPPIEREVPPIASGR